jgi:predicted lipoprotein with Yx(FWY)xxD motif
MVSLKRFFLGMSLLMVALFAVACGSSTYTSSGSSGGTTPTTAPTTAPSNSVALLKTAPVTVSGQSVTILTNAQGMTLYYFKLDTATTAACTGACTGNWPPILFTGSGSPTSATTLPGTLSVVTDANGKQVEYNGHPLYRYSQDTAPGQTNGEGVGGKWFVASSTLSIQSAPQITPTTSSGY